MKCCGMNPRIGGLIIAIFGIIFHGIVLGWGAYANRILYIIIPAGLTCISYVYLILPLGTRQHYAFIPFLIYIMLIIVGICIWIGFLIYTQVAWPNYWRLELVKMFDGIAKGELDFNLINYCYMGVLLFLLVFNITGYITALIAFRDEIQRRKQKLIFPASSDFGAYALLKS
ncbi:hypothetical protein M3Y97_00173100 [Aphelenchoides bicaudatus]|nr:hypothetical protein M3Y97_00173100 [Aphelenchoides bicaudatus]